MTQKVRLCTPRVLDEGNREKQKAADYSKKGLKSTFFKHGKNCHY